MCVPTQITRNRFSLNISDDERFLLGDVASQKLTTPLNILHVLIDEAIAQLAIDNFNSDPPQANLLPQAKI